MAPPQARHMKGGLPDHDLKALGEVLEQARPVCPSSTRRT
jgi:hypothetical protein